jgi:hypothetical protein
MQLVVLMKQVLLKKLDKNVVTGTLYAMCEGMFLLLSW